MKCWYYASTRNTVADTMELVPVLMERSDRERATMMPHGQRLTGSACAVGVHSNPELSSQEDFWEEVTFKERPEWSELQSESRAGKHQSLGWNLELC